MSLLEVKNLKVHFQIKPGFLRKSAASLKAVDDVSLTVGSGETVGLVGESGCGKSVLSMSIMRLIPSPPGKIAALIGRLVDQ